MSARQGSGSSIAPIFLRLCLGITFVWAGLAKVMVDMPVQGDDAAVLANLGVISPAGKPTSIADPHAMPTLMALVGPQDKPKEPTPKEPPATAPASAPAPSAAPSTPPVQAANPPRYTAADFPEPVKVKTLYGVAVGVSNATVVPLDDKGAPKIMRLLPEAVGQRPWPIVLAWCATITELVGGAMILVGLFSRFWSLGIAFVMGVAMWLTQFGPAIQAGTTTMGFLPSHAAFDHQAWQMLFWQFSLFCSALAVVCLGAGSLSLDGLFFMKSGAPAPKPAAEKPAQG